ncbi:MAG: asparagine synthase (glutamine-hydrolyzing) [Burkholderiaceae bacterium]
MCGLVGAFANANLPSSEDMRRAARRIAHRGPDAEQVWCDESAGIALAHRRLAVIDLSAAGAQPMHSACGRFVIAFNGEIYNHLALRRQLEKSAQREDVHPHLAWRGHSDTETLLACIAILGLPQTLRALQGMYAFALWDRQARVLSLARDPMGEKPLYFGFAGPMFVFGSELKALRALPGFEAEIDRNALADFVGAARVTGERSIYRHVRRLRPGSLLSVDAAALAQRKTPEPSVFWSLADTVHNGVAHPLSFENDAAAVDVLSRLIGDAVAKQMQADVPLGAFLSGGIDSSTVVAMMQERASQPVRTFSIGFEDPALDESPYARAIARHLGTEHHEQIVDPATARSIVPTLPEVYCEPFADPSQIPTILVARMARDHVTVSLSGDAGDELFCGYSRYFLAEKLWRLRSMTPARRTLSGLLKALPVAQLNHLIRRLGPVVPASLRSALPGDRINKGAEALIAPSFLALYRDLFMRYWPPELVLGAGATTGYPTPQTFAGLDQLQTMMLEDGLNYLPDDILVKVDRAAMAVSLETRIPLLDPAVVDFAARLPMHYKVRDGRGKWLLREVLRRHVPSALFDRPKKGFGAPIDAWLRGPLREWAESLIEPARLRREGLLDPEPITNCWREHLSGERNWQYHLWTVLMFQQWRESQDQSAS